VSIRRYVMRCREITAEGRRDERATGWRSRSLLGEHVLECAAKIPLHLKYSRKKNKIILRKLAEKYLPKAIVEKLRRFGIHWFLVRSQWPGGGALLLNSRALAFVMSFDGVFQPAAVRIC